MSIDMDIFCLDVTFTMLFAAVLSVATGVGGCGWTISAMDVRMDVALWNFSNNPTNPASVAYAMMFLMILHYTCTGPFPGGIDVIGGLLLNFGPKKKYSPDLLFDSGSEMYDASGYMCRIIPLLIYSIITSGRDRF